MRLALPLLLAGIVLAGLAQAGDIPPDQRRSDSDSASPEMRGMQEDDFANPGMLAVAQGKELWSRPEGTAKKTCAGCHGAAPEAMQGVAARYPAFDAKAGRVLDLEARINRCRTEHEGAAPLAPESADLLALTAFVANKSRDVPVHVAVTGPAAPAFAAGRTLYQTRMGQLNLSCAQCHDDNWGQMLSSGRIPQGHGIGYPTYRLEWQSIGSLQRRLRNCMIGMRAEPFDYGAPEYVALELYLAWRADGLLVETPAVRP